MIGAYSINNSVMDIVVMNIFGLLGYFLKKTNYEGAPMILALVLGPMFENSLRLSLVISKGSFLIFFTRPISIAFIAAAFLVLISPYIFGKKKPVLPDAGDT
jgi:putative tricarboxylic transport membrane protein